MPLKIVFKPFQRDGRMQTTMKCVQMGFSIFQLSGNVFFHFIETQCEPPTPTTGSVYSCSGGNVDYLGTCDLTCTSGYVGARQLTCDQHTTNAALSTYDTPSACTSKYL